MTLALARRRSTVRVECDVTGDIIVGVDRDVTDGCVTREQPSDRSTSGVSCDVITTVTELEASSYGMGTSASPNGAETILSESPLSSPNA